MRSATSLLLAGALLAPAAARAQSDADRTGTGGGPRSTITAPHTSSSGRTMPRGDDRALERGIEGRTREERRDDAIDGTICAGCR
ncbi:conserved hypothetical protein [Methylobacterium sp. 4-46]|uniref:hypothetical protein n=1 Tax=unclassified Methylobacterium TaxID=2615210 RepID=UPI000165CBB1|nr:MULTISPECIES: hypothetical protein [Methylobacterium]ACA20573.1 conserved hypothetical protein [Methylobacterium sp. 4-46]WFT79738.1 hypothetical protein QA634_31860 [Methylobacterium nodulans]